MTTSSIKLYHKQMKSLFGKMANKKAKEIGFVQRESKINGSLFLQALIWTVYRCGQISLPSLAATAEELEPKCKVTEQAFNERFNSKAVAFLQAMFAFALQQNVPHRNLVLPLLSAFSAVYLLDSSNVPLPESLENMYKGCGGAASKAACKLYLLLNWLNGSYQAIKIHEGKKADQNMGQHFVDELDELDETETVSGALWIFDLGFWDLDFLTKIAAKLSYFLTRLQSQVAISLKDSFGQIKRFDLDRFLKVAPRERTFELSVYLGARQLLPSRLICVPLPPQVINMRRRKAKEAARKQGRIPKQSLLKRLDWNLFVTNAPQELLPTTVIGTIYRVRWQIELVFKLAKSDAKLEKTKAQKAARVICELYAKLIGLLLFERMMALLPQPENLERCISYPKAWQRLKDKVMALGIKLRRRKNLESLQQLISIIRYLQRRAKVSKRQKYPSTIQRIKIAAQEADNCRIIDPIGYFEYLEIRRNFNHVKRSQSLMCSDVNKLLVAA